jgi:hypothetical protein
VINHRVLIEHTLGDIERQLHISARTHMTTSERAFMRRRQDKAA